jgi:hypothetical protein
LGEKNLVKSLLISTLDEVIYHIGTFLQGSTNLSSLHKIGWRPAAKNLPIFFNIRVIDLDFYAFTSIIVDAPKHSRNQLSATYSKLHRKVFLRETPFCVVKE